ncbi:MAG: ABC transporter substrate-binding protein [Actinomycetota bacterium]
MTFTPRIRIAALVAAGALALAACGTDDVEADAPDTTGSASGDVVVETFAGGETVLPANPKSIVVLDWAALDTIDALGAGNLVVAGPMSSGIPPYLEDYSSLENAGSLQEPNFEAINAIDPDLIIIGGRGQANIDELSNIAPTMNMSVGRGSDNFVDSVTLNTTALGTILDLEDEAAAILAELETEAAEVAELAATRGTGLVIMTSGGELSAYGPAEEGRYDMVYGLFGVEPAATQTAVETHGDVISFEFLSDTNPDMLIVLDRDSALGDAGESAQQILDNDLVNGTNAVINDQVVYVDTASWYLSTGGVQAFATMIEDMNDLLS